MHERIANIHTHIEFGDHGELSGYLLDPMANQIKTHLESSPNTRVIIVFEETNVTNIDSAAILMGTRKGMLVSDTYALIDYLEANGTSNIPSNEALASWKQEYLNNLVEEDPFKLQELQKVDALQERFPGRIIVVCESGNPLDEVDEMDKAEELEDQSIDLAIAGQFDEALPLYKESILQTADLTIAKRDKRLVDLFGAFVLFGDLEWERNMETSNTDLLIISYLGSCHTGVFHELKRQGVEISRSFPEKQGKYYLFDPSSTMERRLRFFPNRQPSEFEWLRALAMTAIFSVAIAHKAERGHKMTEGTITQGLYNYLAPRLDTEDKIRRFERDIRGTNFIQALKWLTSA